MEDAVSKIIQGTCVYCGKENALSEDYVIPQCLFTRGWSEDIPKVGTCKSCNNEEKSANATSLRDVLLLAKDSSEHPTAQQLYENFALAVGQSQSTLPHDAVQSQFLSRFPPSGMIVGWAHGTELPGGQIIATLTMMVRGLYHAY